MGKPLGELNGRYAMLFKINMILIPIVFSALLTWGIWVTGSIHRLQAFVDYGPRFNQRDASAMEKDILEHVDEHYVRKAD